MITGIGIAGIAFYLLILLLLVPLVGSYLAIVYEGKLSAKSGIFAAVEHFIYRCCFIQPKKDMNWKQYLNAMLSLNLLGIFFVYFLQRTQFYLPLNPQQYGNFSPFLAFNTAVSFVTNTDWQAYSNEASLSYLTSMLGLTSQNFLSAATGMSILVAFIRGLRAREGKKLGNFWVDMVRGILYILLPLSFLLAMVLVSEGVIQNFKPNTRVNVLDVTHSPSMVVVRDKIAAGIEQVIPMGPVASLEAIKQLGTNGGGFFNANAAHPFENPTPITNFLEMLAILLLPASFCYAFGIMMKDRRQGIALIIAMLIIFIPSVLVTIAAEQAGNPRVIKMGVDNEQVEGLYPAGNMEGKETRFGIVSSGIWAVLTTASSSGSVNAMLDSFTPIGGMISLWMMHLGEVVFGGVGSGLYGMLLLVIITVFIAGLMVGRTPEYLGKKIEPFEMKMASLASLIMPLTVLFSTALATQFSPTLSEYGATSPHKFTEMLYAFTSMANNNGSAFAGLNANTPFYNVLGGLLMLVGRFWIAIAVLAIAGSLAGKKKIPRTAGTLSTDTAIFILLLVGVAFLLGALSFLPALALGPVVEHILLWGNNGY